MRPRHTALLATLCLSILCSTAVLAASIPSAEVVTLLRGAKIIDPDYPIRAVMADKQATILTRRKPRASEGDMKIDAMLIAKTIVDSYGADIQTVNVLFSTEAQPDAYAKIAISEQEVRSFGAGKINETQLMQSLQVAHEDDASLVPEAQKDLQPGPFMEQRLALQDQIQALKSGGTGTAPFEQLFQQVEDSIKDGQTSAAREQLADLADRLKEQVQLKKEANAPKIGYSSSQYQIGALRNGSGNRPGPQSFRDDSRPSQNVPHVDRQLGKARLEAIARHCSSSGGGISVARSLMAASIAAAQQNYSAAENILSRIEGALGLPNTYQNSVPAPGELNQYSMALGGEGALLRRRPRPNSTGQSWAHD